MDDEAHTFLEDLVRRRGYVEDFHRVLAAHDVDFLRAYEEMMEAAHLRPRRLTRLTKEFLYISLLAGVGGSRDHLRSHMAAAASEGATAADILEVLELTLLVAGEARFVEAIAVWREVFGA